VTAGSYPVPVPGATARRGGGLSPGGYHAPVIPPAQLALLFPLAALLACAGAPAPTRDRAGPARTAIAVSAAIPDAAPGRLAEPRDDPAADEAAFARRLAVADDPEARLGRALALERLGRDAEAIIELERLRSADPARAGVRARLAERYEAVGRLGDAEAELRALAGASAGRPEGWRRLAAFCRRHGLAGKAHDAEEAAREVEAQARPPRELRPLLPARR
jgi:tetratricopeptide (TPR) repeat protein